MENWFLKCLCYAFYSGSCLTFLVFLKQFYFFFKKEKDFFSFGPEEKKELLHFTIWYNLNEKWRFVLK